MKTISAVDLRNNLADIVKSLKRGERMSLTYRGKPVAELTPLPDASQQPEDPLAPLKRIWARTSRDSNHARKVEESIQEIADTRKHYGERFAG